MFRILRFRLQREMGIVYSLVETCWPIQGEERNKR